MNEEEKELLDKHDEALFGTKLNPSIGLVPQFKEEKEKNAPLQKLVEDAKWPLRIAGLALTGYAVTQFGNLIEFIGRALGGGK